jgi:hypothetical protein
MRSLRACQAGPPHAFPREERMDKHQQRSGAAEGGGLRRIWRRLAVPVSAALVVAVAVAAGVSVSTASADDLSGQLFHLRDVATDWCLANNDSTANTWTAQCTPYADSNQLYYTSPVTGYNPPAGAAAVTINLAGGVNLCIQDVPLGGGRPIDGVALTNNCNPAVFTPSSSEVWYESQVTIPDGQTAYTFQNAQSGGCLDSNNVTPGYEVFDDPAGTTYSLLACNFGPYEQWSTQ